jgi:DNA polymerase-3 subunit chi
VVRLEFHTDVGDPLAYACRLLRKAYRRALKVVVCGEAERLTRLDTLLWTFEQQEFVPHARLRSGERTDPALAGRARWRHYATLGLTPVLANASAATSDEGAAAP